MKKIFFALAVIAMSQAAIAQEKTQPAAADKSVSAQSMERKQHRKMHHDGMKAMKDLNLSEDQKAKMKEMRAANKEKKDAILSDSKLSEDQKKEQLKEMHKGQKDQMKNLLTDEQKTKMKELKEQRKNAKKANGKSITSAAPKSEQK